MSKIFCAMRNTIFFQLREVDVLKPLAFDRPLFNPDVIIPFENLDTGR